MNHVSAISADVPDWTRERPSQFWDPGRKLLRTIRRYQHWRGRRGPWATMMCKWLGLRHRFWSTTAGADIPLSCQIGGGLLLPNPNGIVIHPDAQIGVNCLIFQQVTIGTRGSRAPTGGSALPDIAGHVDVGAGAKILGGVKIGEHARIGANAVVLADVPPMKTVVGIHR